MTLLEQQMQELRELPGRVERVESQILQLRTEMKDGFSAIRSDRRVELHGVEAGLRTELHEVRDTLRAELHEVRDTLRAELYEVRDTLRAELHEVRGELREDIRIGIEESQNLAKGLHAEALAAVSTLKHDAIDRLDRLLELQQPRE